MWVLFLCFFSPKSPSKLGLFLATKNPSAALGNEG
jgi:hypothetical protein